MKRLLALLSLLLLAAPAAAQLPGGVQQSGAVTAGHCATWTRSGVIQDGGATCPTLSAPLSPTLGGTGVSNNAANTLTFSGNFGLTLTLSNTTSLTLPTAGTLAILGANTFTGTQTFADGSTWSSSGISMASAKPILAANGSSSVPAYSFSGETGMGFYFTGTAHQTVFATNAHMVAMFGDNIIRLSGAASLSFSGTTDPTAVQSVGFSLPANSTLSVDAGAIGNSAGKLVLGNATFTAAAPTAAAGQIAFGGTTAASTNCGSLAGAAACIVVNVAGITHYIPYY